MVCADIHAPSCDLRSQEPSRRLYQIGQVVSPSICIEVWVEHSDVDGLLDTPGGPVSFPVKDLYILHGDLVAWPPI